MSKVECLVVSIHQFLDSHQESIRSGERDLEVEALEDVELPLDNVGLCKLRIS
jgi:hypothetical protein